MKKLTRICLVSPNLLVKCLASYTLYWNMLKQGFLTWCPSVPWGFVGGIYGIHEVEMLLCKAKYLFKV